MDKFIHGDFNHTQKDLIKMIKKFETNLYDLICGSRFIQNGYSSTFFRHHSSKLFNFYVNFFWDSILMGFIFIYLIF